MRKPKSTTTIFHVTLSRGERDKDFSKSQLLNPDEDDLREILMEFEDVFQEELPDCLPPQRDVDHEIRTPPDLSSPHRPSYQLSPSELLAAKEYVEKLLNSVKIRRSQSPYGSPLFYVKEPGRPLRGVVEYRALNRITKRNNAPPPRCEEMFDRLGHANYFSKLDLKTGFHQIRMRPRDIEKTTFNIKYGKFEYMVMPMGLCNAPATLQSLMTRVMHDFIDDFLTVYIDELLIYSDTREGHSEHIRAVLTRFREHRLHVSPKECQFMTCETEFLGLIVGNEGLQVNPAKVEVVKNWPRPRSLTKRRSVLGLVQFFRRFIKDFSKRAGPLTALTQKNVGIRGWDVQAELAFDDMKRALTTVPVLRPPIWSEPFRLHIDASKMAVGATLTQLGSKGNDRVIAYMSRKLTRSEQNYTANERELLCLIFSLQRFRCYLEGSTYDVLLIIN